MWEGALAATDPNNSTLIAAKGPPTKAGRGSAQMGSSSLAFGLMVAAAPAEARMMALIASHWLTVSRSLRNNRPERAAMAGSMLISVLKVRAGRRVRATISRL